jgi:hypothetical protein
MLMVQSRLDLDSVHIQTVGPHKHFSALHSSACRTDDFSTLGQNENGTSRNSRNVGSM